MNEPDRHLATVWRRAAWRCEYWIALDHPGGVVRLLFDREVATARKVAGIDEILAVSAYWLKTIEGPRRTAAAMFTQTPNRRQEKPDRRAVQRGGRRRGDRRKT